jgi:hypothetical protein
MRALLLIPLLVSACTDEAPVETRVCNRTEFEITTLVPYANTVIEVMPNEACTPYMIERQDAYARTAAVFTIGTDRFEYLPLDFLGQKPLPPGRWSYELRITDYAAHRFTTLAVED